MATVGTESKANEKPAASEYEKDARAEIAEIKSALAALTQSLIGYGKARADGMQEQATDWSDEVEEVIAETQRATKKLGKQLSRLEKKMETKVREHPLQWFLGALGLGLLFAMLVQRNRD